MRRQRFAKLNDSPATSALESRMMLDGDDGTPPSAGDDSYWTYHDSCVSGMVGDNDSGGAVSYGLNFSVSQQPSNGAVVMDPVTGGFTYTPNSGFIGLDTFAYVLSNAWGYDTATVSIDVSNIAPSFEAYLEGTSELEVRAHGDIFTTGEFIGQLLANDNEGDPLTFSSAGSTLLSVESDGRIKVEDGHALSQLVAHNGGSVELTVEVSDTIQTISSLVRVKAATDWGQIVQSEIYLETVSGTIYEVETGADLLPALNSIASNNDCIKSLILKGHAGGGGILVGNDGLPLTCEGGTIYLGDNDITDLMKDITSTSSEIRLRGCFTLPLADRMEDALDGASVYGAMRCVIGIPGTCWAIGIYF